MKVLIDAANLRNGGGRTHLIEFLNHYSKNKFVDVDFVVWGSIETIRLLPKKNGIIYKTHYLLNKGLFFRSFWQKFLLPYLAKRDEISILFAPGGNVSCNFQPSVTMSRNMLPFDSVSSLKYFPSLFYFKLLLLRYFQTKSFKKVNGLIFLSDYARTELTRLIGVSNSCNISLIPHGLNSCFITGNSKKNKSQNLLVDKKSRINLLYVSPVDMYKNHNNVIKAVYNLRNKHKIDLNLKMIGGGYKKSLTSMFKLINSLDPKKDWINYCGSLQYSKLPDEYSLSDIGIFASSCENLPNTLIEKMGAGLPIACSNMGPMREVGGDSVLYFNPYDISSIEHSLESLIFDEKLRADLSKRAFESALKYDWDDTVFKTIDFLRKNLN